MSLKFLAVGQTFAGIRGDKSPYAMRKENQLPSFQGAPRYKHAEKTMIQTDWLDSPRPARPAPELGDQSSVEGAFAGPVQPAFVPPVAEPPKRRWFSFFRLKWFRTNKSGSDLIQSELSLDKIQPVRNDLANSDLKLVLKRKKKAQPVFASTQENNSLGRSGWSELTAKLFEIGQK